MGKRGPKAQPKSVLKARGSWRAAKPNVPEPVDLATIQRPPYTPPDDAELDRLIMLVPGYDPHRDAGEARFDYDIARRAIEFIETRCRHIEGAKAGQLFKMEDWQRAVTANLFGWVQPDEFGRVVRRYREAFVFVPRKNGKTPWAAALSNYVFFRDPEEGQQDTCAAGDREQAALLYRQMAGMIGQEPELEQDCQVYKSLKSIQRGNSFFRVVSADADNKHGGNAHLIIVDELHVQPNRDLVDTLQTSMASANRPQPLFVSITTAGFDKLSICYEKYDYAKKVCSGELKDARYLPVIFEAGEKDDWKDEQVWAKCNPNLGVSVSLDYLRRECKKAQAIPAYENTFRRLHLNQWTEQDVRWIPMDRWRECPTVPLSELNGRECFGGLDLSSKIALTASVLLFPWDDGYALLCDFWMPDRAIHTRENEDHAPYSLWIKQGFIRTCPGDCIDYGFIRRRLNEQAGQYQIRSIGFDPWNAAQFALQLQDDGLKPIEVRQNVQSLNEPCKEFERLVTALLLRHNDNPVLTWMAGNVRAITDRNGNILPSKAATTTRIDGISATLTALAVAMAGKSRASVYDSQELLVL